MFPEYVAKNPKPEVVMQLGQLRAAGSSFYAAPTETLDVINNRFMQKRVHTVNNPDDIEKRLQAAVVMKRVRVEEFFFDFDKLRRGKVTKNQFEQILSMLNFNLSAEEFTALAVKYKTPTDPEYMVNYKDFCASINGAFTTYGIQKDPMAKVAPVTVDNTVPARRKYLQFTAEEKAMIDGILAEYKEAVRIKRIHLKPMFQDFDITKDQHVTKHQFLRTLGQLGVSTSEDVLNVLLKAYMDKGNVDEVNYYDFCEDVDNSDALFNVGRGYNHSFDYYPKTRPRPTGIDIKKDRPDDVEDVVAKLRQHCKEQRTRISEFFRDFDKLRSGYITEAQFRIGLNMSKIVLSGAEFRLLADHFQAPKEGAHVKWREFSDSVDEVFTTKNLERSVDIPVGDARTHSIYGKAEPSPSDEAIVGAFQDKFKALVQRERLDAKSFFQDQDRHNYFKVSPKQFKQTVTLLGVEVSDEVLAAVVKVYGNKLGDIEYLPFLKDTFVLRYQINEPFTGAKSTYTNVYTDFSGSPEVAQLMKKLKDQVMRARIRVGEFLQDHDPLRKGTIEATKFRTTLYSQKLQLTKEEYQLLEDHYRDATDPIKIRYFDFNQDIENIFTLKDLEKNPQTTLSAFKAPSILDP
jgi:Ca2+-binding EF-hand superfamily protein